MVDLDVSMTKGVRAEQYPQDEIINDNDRIARCWVSVEALDKQNEVVPVSELKRAMNTWMKRDAPISDTHTNKIVGKGLRWFEGIHPVTKTPGIQVEYQIHDDYSADNKVWNEIKSGKRTGVSIGGRATQSPTYKDDVVSGMRAKHLSGIELHEVASVDTPANPYALNTNVNYIAKNFNSEKQILNDLSPFDDVAYGMGGIKSVNSQDDYRKEYGFYGAQEHQIWIDNLNMTIRKKHNGQQVAQFYDKNPNHHVLDDDVLPNDNYWNNSLNKISELVKGCVQTDGCNVCKLILNDYKDDVGILGDMLKATNLCNQQNKNDDSVSHQKDISMFSSHKLDKQQGSDQLSQSDLSDSFACFKDMHNYYLNMMQKASNMMKPFSGFINFDACTAAQASKGHSEESAARICGWLKNRTEKADALVPFESGANDKSKGLNPELPYKQDKSMDSKTEATKMESSKVEAKKDDYAGEGPSPEVPAAAAPMDMGAQLAKIIELLTQLVQAKAAEEAPEAPAEAAPVPVEAAAKGQTSVPNADKETPKVNPKDGKDETEANVPTAKTVLTNSAATEALVNKRLEELGITKGGKAPRPDVEAAAPAKPQGKLDAYEMIKSVRTGKMSVADMNRSLKNDGQAAINDRVNAILGR